MLSQITISCIIKRSLMVIIASSHFMHKTAKRQCLHDKEGKGCPRYLQPGEQHPTFMHKAVTCRLFATALLSLVLMADVWLLALAWSWDYSQVRVQAQASKYAPSQAQAASWVNNLFISAMWQKMLLRPIRPWQCLLPKAFLPRLLHAAKQCSSLHTEMLPGLSEHAVGWTTSLCRKKARGRVCLKTHWHESKIGFCFMSNNFWGPV